MKEAITMAKSKTIWLQLTPIEANAIMVMLDSEMQTWHDYGGGISLQDWETFDLDAYKLLAYKHYREWYEENCSE
jgi:hypothetical protein